MPKKLTAGFKKHPYRYGIVALIVVIVALMLAFGGKETPEETIVVSRGQFLSEVAASGKVVAPRSSTLGFDQSGRIAAVNAAVGDQVKAGQVLASIDNGSIRADVAQREAALERERARLAALYRGTRPEQIALAQQKYADASSALLIAMNSAYLETEGAILTMIDSLFTNGASVNPTLKIRARSDNEKRSIENDRLIVTEKLTRWKDALSKTSVTSDAADVISVRTVGTDAMQSARALINRLADNVNDMTLGNSGESQSAIDAYRSTVNTAGQSVSATASAEQSAYSTWSTASNSLTLEKSGSTPEEIAAQEAQVKAAEADLANAQAQLRKTLVVAPFDGIVTRMDVKVGEIVSPGSSGIAMIGTGLFEIESFIPEVNISRLSVGNPATITLDAYGSDIIFDATVIAIDPAETLRDGVSTYKTTLRFIDEDQRIKPGMTANIRITAESKSGVIILPRSAITTSADGTKTVKVRSRDVVRDVVIQTGSMTALGQVEVISGLSEGDVVVLPPLVR